MEAKNIFKEIIAEKFSNLIKSINLTDPRILTNLSPRNIKLHQGTSQLNWLKWVVKRKILKAKRKKPIVYKENDGDGDDNDDTTVMMGRLYCMPDTVPNACLYAPSFNPWNNHVM